MLNCFVGFLGGLGKSQERVRHVRRRYSTRHREAEKGIVRYSTSPSTGYHKKLYIVIL
jgi:hypothetical protein